MTFFELSEILSLSFHISVKRCVRNFRIDAVDCPLHRKGSTDGTLFIGPPEDFCDTDGIVMAIASGDIPGYKGDLCVIPKDELLLAGLKAANMLKSESSVDKSMLASLLQATAENQHSSSAINSFAILLGNPLVLLDPNMNIMLHSRNLSPNDPFWNKKLVDGSGGHEFVRLLQSGRKHTGDDRTQMITPKGAKPMLISCDMQNDQITCFLVMTAQDLPINESHWLLLPLLCRHICWICNTEPNFWQERQSIYKVLLYDILDGKDNDYILNKAITDGIRFPDQMRVVVAEYTEPDVTPQQNRALMLELKTLIPRSFSIIYKNSAVLLAADNPGFTEDEITGLTRELSINVGVSNRFTSPFFIKSAFAQAVSAIRASAKRANPRRIYHYRDCWFTSLCSALPSAMLPQFVFPELFDLLEYDRKNNACLCATLKAFLESGCIVNAAAKALFMHRNTMFYRIRRIEELTAFELSDHRFTNDLYFSLKVLEYLHPEAFAASVLE